jgi:hypothetical protein
MEPQMEITHQPLELEPDNINMACLARLSAKTSMALLLRTTAFPNRD